MREEGQKERERIEGIREGRFGLLRSRARGDLTFGRSTEVVSRTKWGVRDRAFSSDLPSIDPAIQRVSFLPSTNLYDERARGKREMWRRTGRLVGHHPVIQKHFLTNLAIKTSPNSLCPLNNSPTTTRPNGNAVPRLTVTSASACFTNAFAR